MLENPRCPHCGHDLDISFEKDGSKKINACTNSDCPSNSVSIPKRGDEPTN